MKIYKDLVNDILECGEQVTNARTGANCLTVINRTLVYTQFPLVTTRKCFWKSAIAEMLGYIRGYQSAKDFRDLGTKTWDANANENPAWLANPNRKGQDDMGLVYGAVGNQFTGLSYPEIVEALASRNDNRGLIWSFWNPNIFDQGCLRPCMLMHQFSILNNKLYLTSYQRSVDVPLGLTFNTVQCWFLLFLTAALAGLEMGTCTHHLVNAHIYENQIAGCREQMKREPLNSGTFGFSDDFSIENLNIDYVLKDMTPSDFQVTGYQHHPPIVFPFTV